MKYKPPESNAHVWVNLWPGFCWDEQDLDGLVTFLSDVDASAGGNRTAELRGVGLQTVFEFATCGLAAAFFAKIGARLGEDAYIFARQRLIGVLTAAGKRSAKSEDFDYLSIDIDDVEGRAEISLSGVYRDEEELNRFLPAAYVLFSAIRVALREYKWPLHEGSRLQIFAAWHPEEGVEWDLRYVVSSATDKHPAHEPDGGCVFIRRGEFSHTNDWLKLRWMSLDEGCAKRRMMGDDT